MDQSRQLLHGGFEEIDRIAPRYEPPGLTTSRAPPSTGNRPAEQQEAVREDVDLAVLVRFTSRERTE